jgi:hypothetical protein
MKTQYSAMPRYHPSLMRFPPIVPGDPISVSATLFMTFARCPDQALGRLHGVFPEESTVSFKGGLAHRVFARHLVRGPIPDVGVEQACREEIGAGLNPKLSALGLRPSQLAGVISEVGDLYQRFKALSTEGFRAPEVFIEVEPESGVRLRGSIDAVFDDADGVRLVDWKTGGLYETEQQLGFYAMLWALDRDEVPVRVEAVSVGSGERLGFEPTESTISQTANEVAGMINQLRGSFARGIEQLERVAGPWCSYCPLLESCPEGVAAVRLGSPRAGRDAVATPPDGQ